MIESNEDGFLQESDFDIQNNIDTLKEKLQLISDFTSLTILDLSDEDLDSYDETIGVVTSLRNGLFINSDEIIKNRELHVSDPIKDQLYKKQEALMKSWVSFNLSESMFLKLYQTHTQSFTNESKLVREGSDLLFQILLEQESLITIFNIKLKSNVILDLEDFL